MAEISEKVVQDYLYMAQNYLKSDNKQSAMACINEARRVLAAWIAYKGIENA